ncbi:MAG: bacteriophage holin [Halobacteriaceae archaeon]
MVSNSHGPIDKTAFSATCAIVWASYVAIIGVMARFGWGERWRSLLSDVYIGFDKTVSGIGIGAAWGALDGFIGGWLIATLYNRLTAG